MKTLLIDAIIHGLSPQQTVKQILSMPTQHEPLPPRPTRSVSELMKQRTHILAHK